jgi:tetratricopeptide (TPR) repeat protein
MPQRVKMNVIFRTVDDAYVPPVRRYEHRISVDSAARDEVLLAWYRRDAGEFSRQEAQRLAESLVSHWLSEAENYRRQHRFRAQIGALREALRVSDDAALRGKLQEVVALQERLDDDMATAVSFMDRRRFSEAIPILTGIVNVQPDHAKAHGKLGTCYAITGQLEIATEHLQTASRCDPDDSYGLAMLAWLAYLDDRAAEAVELFRRADEIEPYNAKINYQLGLALVKLERWQDAIASFRQVLVIDPLHAEGCVGLSQTLRRLGRTDEAIPVVQRVSRLTGGRNPDVLMELAESYAALDRWGDAAQAAAKALDSVDESQSAVIAQIRARLAAFRARAGKRR